MPNVNVFAHKTKEILLIVIPAIKADTAISQLPEKDQGYMTQLVTSSIQKLINIQNTLKEKH
jgi:hypothetical protein